ncbi:MAG: 4-hydroxythreonine-4-phosphate dehydrogenase PdxA [Negativicutes bacterium]|nr:4-hydroxythreonine-4-phosphate dehydrogenase PdxA [Negativicutes bacterium]
MKPILGILLGDATGIGPELVAKLCAEDRLAPYCWPVLIGDARVLAKGQETAKTNFTVKVIDDVSQADWKDGVPLLDQKNLDPAAIEFGKISKLSGKVTGDMLVSALRLAQQGAIDGFVYAPLNKAALKYGGYNFEDEQKLMAHYLDWDQPCGEMNVLNNLWTSRVTSHIPLDQVGSNINVDNILRAIRLADRTLRLAGFARPRIGVAALNPHGGEGGLCGRQEIDIIAPAVGIAVEEGIAALGPYSADTIFINAFKGNYDAVVTMFHDQGQIAIKLMGFQFGVTVAAGMPYPITTPAHGTAFDIAGQGVASPDATEQAVIIAAKMAASAIRDR